MFDRLRILCTPSLIYIQYTIALTFNCFLGRIAKNNHLIYTFMYTVKNTQANVVKVKVMEQIPTSSDEKLKVSSLLVETSLSICLSNSLFLSLHH